MIAYLPEIYPDELVYSWFCRLAVHTGFGTSIGAHRLIYGNRRNTPNKEFIGNISPEMREAVETQLPIRQLILEHTMFPQYMRFYPQTKKQELMEQMVDTALPRSFISSILRREQSDLYMKYCPLCVQADRERYGETYWHRVHQVRGMVTCPLHGCRLINASLSSVYKSDRISYHSAESCITDLKSELETDETIIRYNRYLADNFWADVNLEYNTSIKDILFQGLLNKGYLSRGKKLRLTNSLSEDMNNYYVENQIHGKVSQWQIQRIFIGERFDFDIVCRLGFFLEIDNLINPDIPDEVIKLAESIRYTGKERPDFTMYDKEMVNIFEQKCQEYFEGRLNPLGRPNLVGPYKMEMLMGWPPCRLRRMPLCNAVMQKYLETNEQFSARRLAWAYNRLKASGKDIIWYDFRRLTALQRPKAIRCLDLLTDYTDEESAKAISSIIEGN